MKINKMKDFLYKYEFIGINEFSYQVNYYDTM